MNKVPIGRDNLFVPSESHFKIKEKVRQGQFVGTGGSWRAVQAAIEFLITWKFIDKSKMASVSSIIDLPVTGS